MQWLIDQFPWYMILFFVFWAFLFGIPATIVAIGGYLLVLFFIKRVRDARDANKNGE